MIEMGLSGANGKMGQVITRMCAESDKLQIAVGFDINTNMPAGFPVYSDPSAYRGDLDVVVDFSTPAALDTLLAFCVEKHVPMVVCTTGLSDGQLDDLTYAAKKIPIFRSGNMSLGINLICELLGTAARVLGENYDVEIIERHHNQKIDAPSGTALMLADAVRAALPYAPEYVYDRHSVRQKRNKEEIGIHTVRGGTIVGEHEVLFCGTDEVIEIRHVAGSREVFATGALQAAEFMAAVSAPGLYNMSDIIRARGI